MGRTFRHPVFRGLSGTCGSYLRPPAGYVRDSLVVLVGDAWDVLRQRAPRVELLVSLRSSGNHSSGAAWVLENALVEVPFRREDARAVPCAPIMAPPQCLAPGGGACRRRALIDPRTLNRWVPTSGRERDRSEANRSSGRERRGRRLGTPAGRSRSRAASRRARASPRPRSRCRRRPVRARAANAAAAPLPGAETGRAAIRSSSRPVGRPADRASAEEVPDRVARIAGVAACARDVRVGEHGGPSGRAVALAQRHHTSRVMPIAASCSAQRLARRPGRRRCPSAGAYVAKTACSVPSAHQPAGGAQVSARADSRAPRRRRARLGGSSWLVGSWNTPPSRAWASARRSSAYATARRSRGRRRAACSC